MNSKQQETLKPIVEKMEEGLRRSTNMTDVELLKAHGRNMELLIRELNQVPVEQRQRFMGRTVTYFCADFLGARKALEARQKYVFLRKWEKTSVNAPNPGGQLQQGEKGSEKGKEKIIAGDDKTGDQDKTSAGEEKPRKSSKGKERAGSGKGRESSKGKERDGSAENEPADSIKSKPVQAKPPAPTKPPAAEKPPASTKPPQEQPSKAPPTAPKKPAAGKKAAKTTAAAGPSSAKPGPQVKVVLPTKPTKKAADDAMDVDPVEKTGGKKQAPAPSKKGNTARPRTAKERAEHGEAAYDPDATEDPGYENAEVGSKRKRETGSKAKPKPRKTKAPKSAETVVDSGDEASAAISKTGTTPSEDMQVDTPDGTSAAGVKKTGRKRSNFKRHLTRETLEEFEAIKARIKARTGLSPEEKVAHAAWVKSIVRANPGMMPTRKLRKNSCAAIVLMVRTLVPPERLQFNESSCDYCEKYCPYRCFVLDQGTSCLMCNFFRHTRCKKDGIPVMMKKGDPEVPVVKKKSKKLVNDQALAEVQQAQSQNSNAIRALQSQMDAMSLGMAACGSVLKNAQDRVEEHRAATSEIGTLVEGRVATLTELIAKLKDGQEKLPLTPNIPHHLIETHLKNISTLVKIGADFAGVFTSLAADAEQVTEVLAQWLQGEGTEEIDVDEIFEDDDDAVETDDDDDEEEEEEEEEDELEDED